jgi:hypothetical protein
MTAVQSAMYDAFSTRIRALWPYRGKRRSEITTMVQEARRLRYGVARGTLRTRTLSVYR